jgi:hypothetical protein
VHKLLKGLTAEAIAEAAAQTDDDPNKMQRKLGNYRKGKFSYKGLRITIENAKGSKRGEKDKFGVKHYVKMPAPYGYIRGTLGADGMQVDCYMGKHPEDSDFVYVIDQDKFDANGTDYGFDEHKCFLAYRTPKKAVKDYLASHYDGLGHERLAAITQMTYREFKSWLKDGDMKTPISEQGIGTVIGRRGKGNGIAKLGDTIGQGIGLLSYNYLRAKPAKSRRKKRKALQGPRWKLVA